MKIKTGGRKKGTPNRRTVERQAAAEQAQEQIAQVIASAVVGALFEGNAHAMLMAVYKDTSQPLVLRVDAAKAAIGYEQPKLAAIEHSGSVDHKHAREFTLAELDARIAELIGGETAPVVGPVEPSIVH